MEHYQDVQNRAGQTVAVIHQAIPALTVGGSTAADLLAQSEALHTLAQARDNALADFDGASHQENQGYFALRSLTLSLPKSVEGELNGNIPDEAALLDLLTPVYSITPHSTARALARGQKLVSVLAMTDAYLTALQPPRPPITSGGKGLAEITAMIEAQPALEQTVEDRAAEVRTTRNALRMATQAVDRLNKRFFSRLKAEARTNATVAAAIGQITTESANQPATLGIDRILQNGADGLHLRLTYETSTYDAAATSSVEWRVVGVDAAFTRRVTADPGGNTLGPFAIGDTVELRTRVKNSNGTRTGSIRTHPLAAR